MVIHGCEVFSATMKRERDALGGQVTEWLAQWPQRSVIERTVRLSSDHSYHCLAIVLWWIESIDDEVPQ